MILQHLEAPDFPGAKDLPHFDGFVFHSGQSDPEARGWALDLLRTRKVMWLYTCIYTKPLEEWLGQGNAWMDYIGDLPTLATPEGQDAIAWAFGRKVIGFDRLSRPQVEGLAHVMKEWCAALTPPSGAMPGVFLDLTVKRPKPWMFRHDGPPFEAFPAEAWPAWERRVLCFIRTLKDLGVPLIINLEKSIPGKLYHEDAQLEWDETWSLWAQEPRDDVLSVSDKDHEAVYRLVDLAKQYPKKWIAFKGAANSWAYTYAAEQLGWA